MWAAMPASAMLAVAGCSAPESGSPAPPVAAVEPAPPARPPPAVPEPARSPGTIRTVDVNTLLGMIETGNLLLIDVRPAFYYGLGHIAGAINLPGRQFDDWFPGERGRLESAVKEGRPIVLYCMDPQCPDAKLVAGWLAERGLTVQVYPGGWEEWKAAGIGG